MARLRSPGYPNFPLPQVIEMARKVHDADRQHAVPREVAAQHMGFSGLTGASDRALSALMHYGLAEKAGKGEIRVSELALSIIHPESGAERRQALHRAAFAPDLFRELRERYPGQPPSSGVLTSFLSRENFAPAAIPPAARAYLETCEFLLREGAYEVGQSSDDWGLEAVPSSPPTIEVQAPGSSIPAVPASSAAPQARAIPFLGGSHPNKADVFTIGSDGEVVVLLPTVLTQDAYDDLKDWLDLIARKAKRKIAGVSTVLSDPPTDENAR